RMYPPIDFDEFCKIIRDGQKADLLDGVIYMASPDSFPANELFLWLARLIGDFVEAGALGNVYGSRAAFWLTKTTSPEPDIAFVRNDRLHLRQRGYFDGAPDLAVEIVSPDSVERDYEDKRLAYEKAGVEEYWIIDPLKETITLLHRGRS